MGNKFVAHTGCKPADPPPIIAARFMYASANMNKSLMRSCYCRLGGSDYFAGPGFRGMEPSPSSFFTLPRNFTTTSPFCRGLSSRQARELHLVSGLLNNSPSI
jgi:hypothetical protein